jgi:FERM central domain
VEPGGFPIENLLPVGILQQFANTSREAWESRIRQLHMEHYGLSRSEAELEHLKVAQNLAMFGVGYFSISVRKDFQFLISQKKHTFFLLPE